MTNRERLREQIAVKVMDLYGRAVAYELADAILALPNLLVKAEDQSLPQYQFPNIAIGEEILTTDEIQQEMLNAGFVKVKKP